MRKLITIIVLLFVFCSAKAQKDSTEKDTVVVLTLQQANELIQDIQIQASGKADIKPQQWQVDFEMIKKGVTTIPKKK